MAIGLPPAEGDCDVYISVKNSCRPVQSRVAEEELTWSTLWPFQCCVADDCLACPARRRGGEGAGPKMASII